MNGAPERTGTDPQVLDLTQGLVHYIRELVRSGHKPVRNCDRYSSVIWLADLPDGTELRAMDDDGVLLVVDHVPRHPPPALPEVLRGWVDAQSLDKPAGEDPELAEAGPGWAEGQPGDGSATFTATNVGRNERPDVLRAYREWIVLWRRWAEAERLAAPRRILYKQLSRVARQVAQADDVYEVVLGIGLLTGEISGRPPLARHLTTKKVGISTDRVTARITLALADDSPVRFEDRDFLSTEDGYSLERCEPLRAELATQDPDPLGEGTARLLARWADIALDTGVRFSTAWERQRAEENVLALSLTPAIMIRERDANTLVRYYDQIAASLTGPRARSPLGLAQLIAPLEKTERLAWGGAETVLRAESFGAIES